MTTRLLRTIFLTSVFSYAGFAFIDYIEPGVVSDVVSVHLWLLPIIVSGIFWAKTSNRVTPPTTPSPSSGRRGAAPRLLVALFLGLAIGTILWHNGTMFGDFRLLLALSGAVLPVLTVFATKHS